MTDCIFVKSETVQNILHEYCENPKMLEINEVKGDKPLSCMGSAKCGNAIKKEAK